MDYDERRGSDDGVETDFLTLSFADSVYQQLPLTRGYALGEM